MHVAFGREALRCTSTGGLQVQCLVVAVEHGDIGAAGDDLPPARNHWLIAAHHAVLRLAPGTYFADGKPIMREQVRDWEKRLKAVLVSWASNHGLPGLEAAREVLQQLKAVSAWALDAQNDAVDGCIRAMDFLHMLRGLDRKGMLPMLTFSFDRRKCEWLAGQSCPTAQPIMLGRLHKDVLHFELGACTIGVTC